MGTGLRDAGKYVEREGRGRVQKKQGFKEREWALERVNLGSIFVIWMNRLVRAKQSLNSLKDVCSGRKTLRCWTEWFAPDLHPSLIVLRRTEVGNNRGRRCFSTGWVCFHMRHAHTFGTLSNAGITRKLNILSPFSRLTMHGDGKAIICFPLKVKFVKRNAFTIIQTAEAVDCVP